VRRRTTCSVRACQRGGSSMDFPIYNPIELQQGLTSGPFEGNWSKLIKLFMDVLEHEAPDLDRFGLAK
ncbi:uncharacterized protein METZ01_LOCUS239389, partial [marine metagenome]